MEIMIVATLVGLITLGYALFNGIGPVPTSAAVADTLAKALPEKVQGDIIEVGAGWGGVAIMLARHYPENRVIAVENSPLVWLCCWLRCRTARLSNLRVCRGDIYRQDFTGAGLVYSYLCTTAMVRLMPRLRLLQSGSVLISHTFSAPGLEPEQCFQARDLWNSPIYFYRLSQ